MINGNGAPTIFVIFGATGDLSRRKLMPALFDLYDKGFLPEEFKIVGFSRQALNHDEFKESALLAISGGKKRYNKKKAAKFTDHFLYQPGFFDNALHYQNLAETLIALDERFGVCSNKLFYLATPPALYETILNNLANSGLTIPCGGAKGWTRVLVEKPFGRDIQAARKLDELLGLLFKEEQIFRIDHYLAKETVQNVLAFRFSNALFEPIWNNHYIERVELRLWEKDGIAGRGEYYDGVGALRDVGQNHILQMLALVAMENPGTLSAAALMDKRALALEALRPITGDAIARQTKRGQYAGFRKEKGVASRSTTETFFKITAYIDNERWRDVPFYLESGKGMGESKAEIVIYFKQPTNCLCSSEDHNHRNVLTFRVQPDEGISILFWAKKPGFDFDLKSKHLSFRYRDSAEERKLPDAYERILYDCVRGDQTLFAGTRELQAAWKFIMPVIEGWGATPLIEYRMGAGSDLTQS
ncbi:MAG: glucose-6-phosphate dehydrogenase [Candidatus Terrybacteria bacterium RIFCSPLOWO2_01_FULL_48_14]|nr:MAG: glucose-6-phosphate dehydrogenase [Candidatus Terrybacteria bacterium RIFCSPLOWO2_01_FULL_48_14]